MYMTVFFNEKMTSMSFSSLLLVESHKFVPHRMKKKWFFIVLRTKNAVKASMKLVFNHPEAKIISIN